MIFREVEDHDLIGRARRGEVEAYNLLVLRREKRVVNCLPRLGFAVAQQEPCPRLILDRDFRRTDLAVVLPKTA